MDFRFKYRRHQASDQESRKEKRSESERLSSVKGMSYAIVIPTYLASGPLTGWLLGSWLDQRMHTAFWLPTLIVLCTIASFAMVIRMMASLNR
ncbi:MAG: AtpZ/AtpI family protein [bacterium]